MNKKNSCFQKLVLSLLTGCLLISSCGNPAASSSQSSTPAQSQNGIGGQPALSQTPLPTRTTYSPGELVDYNAQSGDTLPSLAARFNTTIDEILQANPQIPRDATTMPPGMPMKMPIYYVALWASPFQILPDHAFVESPTSIGFNTAAFLESQPGWLKNYRVYASGEWRSGAEMVDYISMNYSLNPRLLLAVMEYQGGALTAPVAPVSRNILGIKRPFWETPYLQLVLAANFLNNGYYGWRAGNLVEFEDVKGILIRPDPWQNAASAGLYFYYSKMFSGEQYMLATGPGGLIQTYEKFFGNPWNDSFVLIPGSLQQPEFTLPFPNNQTWSYTGGPHTGWGSGEPFAAVDFAPPAEKSGCVPPGKDNFATAMASGLIVRSGIDGVALDLDKDGDERTGWVIYYLHLAEDQRIPLGTEVQVGQFIGYPSCAGGHATGTHVHIARKYNGEWIVADSAIPFQMSGWVTHNGGKVYLGTLTKGNQTVIACDCSSAFSSISSDSP
ncbi:MAG: LysM peptidoglycan-binding domain-containing protein [Chloroflexi bacterium]|nr:LysM peptidoglycan-binding domain-containing protein [Chloroflexota bacterium]